MEKLTDDKFTLVQPISIPFGPYEMRISNACILYRNSLSFEHWHDEYELHYLVKGDSTLVANGIKYDLKEGQICWINPNCDRFVDTDPKGDHSHFVIHFQLIPRSSKAPYTLLDYSDISSFLHDIAQKQVWTGEPRRRYGRLYGLIVEELEEKKFGHMVVVRNMLCSFITCCIQNLGVALMSDSAYWEQPDNITHSIISYMRNHYAENLSIESVSSELKISPRHLTRLMKEKYGTTFNAALNSFRISKVQEYLALSSESLEHICEATGFSSVSVMSANFQKYTGQTISDYRKTKAAAK